MSETWSVLGHYYGLDWMAMIFGLSGFYLITRHNRLGFAFQGVASVLGCWVAVMSGQGGFVVSNIAFMIIASYGYLAWAQQQSQPEAARVSRKG